MPVDNAGAPTSGDPFQYVVIPINKDVLPYDQLEAQDKYKRLSMPDDIPPTLGILAASDKNFQGDMLSTDGKRNLNVHVANQASGGGGPASMVSITCGSQGQGGVYNRCRTAIPPAGMIIYGLMLSYTFTDRGLHALGDSMVFHVVLSEPSGTYSIADLRGMYTVARSNGGYAGFCSAYISYGPGWAVDGSINNTFDLMEYMDQTGDYVSGLTVIANKLGNAWPTNL